jgi:hypothetical protein
MSTPTPPKAKGGARPGAGRKPNALKTEHNALFDAAWPLDRRKAAIQRLSDLAEKGDDEIALKAAEILFNRVYGKATERKEVAGSDGGPVTIRVVRDADD